MNLTETERAKYNKVWKLPEYRIANHGLELWKSWLYQDRFGKPSSALDIGCGNGRLFEEWNKTGIDGYGVDVSPNALDVYHPNTDKFSLQCLWEMTFDRRFEMGMCADVMEHIPPEKVSDVLRCIASCCDRVMFKIANYPSSFGDEQLHLTLANSEWWTKQLSKFGSVTDIPEGSRAQVPEYVYILQVYNT